MELGRLLVSEYLEERDGDTLSRWFLHAIAERLLELNQAKGEKKRKGAQDAAADLILRFWRHRKATSLNVDPLSRFEKLFKSLELLLPKASPWLSQGVTQTEKLAAELFECLSSLTISLMLLGLSKSDEDTHNRSLFARFLPTNERGMLDYFDHIERTLANQDRAKEAETVSLQSRTVIQTVQAWTVLTRVNLDRVDQILSEADAKLPKEAEAFTERTTTDASYKSAAKKAVKKSATTKRSPR